MVYFGLLGMVLWTYYAVINTHPGSPNKAFCRLQKDQPLQHQQLQAQEYPQSTTSSPAITDQQDALVLDIPSQDNHRLISQLERKRNGNHRYCSKCENIKPDRTHHCSSCGQCILKMDHHVSKFLSVFTKVL
jgi:hypothetical protein